jgi:hypothetical protein
MKDSPVMLSLYDRSGIMAEPWVLGGYNAYIVDIKHPPGATRSDNGIVRIGADIRQVKWRLLRIRNVQFVAAFPPCTDLAVSGARHFAKKRARNPYFQEEAMELLYIAAWIGITLGVPWMIENPVSVASTLWRKPDHYFHPWQYAGLAIRDNYTKKTGLWTGGGFVMPKPVYDPHVPIDKGRIHWMSPSPERNRIRSLTPRGFAKAVYLVNRKY